MAESATKAFGRYLKTLRERRGLSLDDVASLSQTFPEKINKGYLSRCENGHQKLAFSKVIALSRIIEVPADVLVERMELDLELDRVGGPDTKGMSYSELRDAGRMALDEGRFTDAYGYMRDAMSRASLDSVSPTFRDVNEQIAVAQMNCATAARPLGRRKFALHEFLYVEATKQLEPNHYAIALERISGCYRALGDFETAEKHADAAIKKAEASGDTEYVGYFYSTRAHIAFDQSDLKLAVAFYKKAYEAHKAARLTAECASSLNNLSQCYFDQKRYGAAKRTCMASAKLSKLNNHHHDLALSLILLGEIDEIENRHAQAAKKWNEAVAIAKRLKDKELRFKAEFVRFRRAVSTGDKAVARAIKRRLKRLAPWLPQDNFELNAFGEMIEDQR
jgi:tetratricopeptide (TPR) repeat protein